MRMASPERGGAARHVEVDEVEVEALTPCIPMYIVAFRCHPPSLLRVRGAPHLGQLPLPRSPCVRIVYLRQAPVSKRKIHVQVRRENGG
jgi:hypothetical protein